MKGVLSKEVVSDEGEVSMGHATFGTSEDSLTKEVVSQRGYNSCHIRPLRFCTEYTIVTDDVMYQRSHLGSKYDIFLSVHMHRQKITYCQLTPRS